MNLFLPSLIKKSLVCAASIFLQPLTPSTTTYYFAPSPTKLPVDVHATTGYKQGSLLERPSGITSSAKGPTNISLDTAIASCTKAISMGSVVSAAAGLGKRTRSWHNC